MDNNPGRIPLDQNRRNVSAGISTADGETVLALEVNPSTGRLLVDTAGGGGGVQYANNTVPTPPITGNALMAYDGLNMRALRAVDVAAEVEPYVGLAVTILDGSGFPDFSLSNIAQQQTDGSQQTQIIDASTNPINDFTVPAVSQPFALPAQIVDGSGNQITSFGGTQYTEGATTTPGSGILTLGRYSSPTPTLATGAMESLQLDSSGNLKVNVAVGGSSSSSSSTAVTSGDVSTIAGQPINTVTPGTQLVSLTDELGDPLRSTTAGALDVAVANMAIDSSANLKTAPGAFEVANPFNSTEQGCALSIKTTQGYLLSVLVTNYNAAKRYLHIISKQSAPANGDTPTFSFPIPAGNSTTPAYLGIGQELFGQGGCYLQFGVAIGVSTTANVFNQASSADHTLAGLYV